MSEFLNLLSEIKKYMTLVEKDGLAIADVPLSYQSKKLQTAAVNQNAEAILLMRNPCKKACEEALLCDANIGDRLDKEIKELYDLWNFENELKESLKALCLSIDIKTNTAYVFNCKDKKVSHIIIPKKFNGYFVSGIGLNAFTGCGKLETIEFPNTITKIRLDAFLGTPWLEEQRKKNPLVVVNNILVDGRTASGEVAIPEGVKTICCSAFFNNINIHSIDMPDSVTEIGYSAFAFCTKLSSVTLSSSIAKIDQHVFYNCTSLLSIVIPDGITEIGKQAFKDCESLMSITIPNSVTEIGESTFEWCRNLDKVIIPKTVTKIGQYAFDDCSEIELELCSSKKDYPNWKKWGLNKYQIKWNCKPKAN